MNNGNPLMQMMGNAMGGGNPMMQNNPIMRIVSMLKSGGNPQAIVQQMVGNNPHMKQIMDTVNGKSQQEMNEYIKKAAQQKGVDLSQLAQSIGMPPEVASRYGIEMPK